MVSLSSSLRRMAQLLVSFTHIKWLHCTRAYINTFFLALNNAFIVYCMLLIMEDTMTGELNIVGGPHKI